MNKHEYTLLILSELLSDLEKCMDAAKTHTLLITKNAKTQTEILASLFALCRVQDDRISNIIQREKNLIERGEE